VLDLFAIRKPNLLEVYSPFPLRLKKIMKLFFCLTVALVCGGVLGSLPKVAEIRSVEKYKFSTKSVADIKLNKVLAQSPASGGDNIAKEALAGFVAALATLPTSISYASVVGLSPLIGIWTSAILGAIVGIIGGAPGVIAGAAGVVAIPLSAQAAVYGHKYTTATIFLAGVLETVLGLSKISKLIDLVTEPVMAGFMNSFAVFLVQK